ncbi:hypothetical protein [Sodalis sp. (in: enterobacteria)]|uniref:hypothetical protein n=1 Tax=Sodalis sp. (in: enterobacteria) TaxID=1898979 RepID=UPI003F2A9F33
MRNTSIPLDVAAYRASVACSLYEVILDKANDEKSSPVLIDLISLACDLNSEVSRSLAAVMEDAA